MAQRIIFLYNKHNTPDNLCANKESGVFSIPTLAIKPIIVTQKEVNQPYMSKQAIYALSDGGSLRTQQEARRTVVSALNRFVLRDRKLYRNCWQHKSLSATNFGRYNEKQLVKVQLCLN